MKREEAELKKKFEAQAEAERKLQESGMIFPEIPTANVNKIN